MIGFGCGLGSGSRLGSGLGGRVIIRVGIAVRVRVRVRVSFNARVTLGFEVLPLPLRTGLGLRVQLSSEYNFHPSTTFIRVQLSSLRMYSGLRVSASGHCPEAGPNHDHDLSGALIRRVMQGVPYG